VTGAESSAGPIDYDGLIVDLDGVVWLGGEPIEGAVHAIAILRASGTGIVFVTNDPQSSRDEHAARLAAIGVPATAADVLTSAAATARFLESQRHLASRDVFVIGAPSLRNEIEQAGLHVVPATEAPRADVVVVGGHDGFDYDELAAATTAVGNGAALYATGRDAVFPTRYGPRPATGAILAAVEVATGVTAKVIGKPEPFIFEIARDALIGCQHVAVIGDHLISDIAGAKRAGLDAILVLTGTATRSDLERAVIQPDLVLPSLAAVVSRRHDAKVQVATKRGVMNERRLRIAIALFPDAEELDWAGPWEVLSYWARVYPDDRVEVFTVSQREGPVTCAKGLRVLADHTWVSAPPIDVLVYPGGRGTLAQIGDRNITGWLRDVAASGALMTSVCTGSLLFADAGLLDGSPATTHWDSLDRLATLGKGIEVRPHERFVDVGDVITASGVSAGIDMALHLITRLHSVERAREVRRGIQYDPHPPV
jgi:HAD superfamily hydrolase (TIGR01450 family)